MSRNLKKFINPKFTRTVPLEPMKRLLERHRREMAEFDFGLFDSDEAAVRGAIFDFFAGSGGDCSGLVADLHRVAAVGTRQGLDLLLAEGRRRGVVLVLNPGRDPAREDPKHVALTAFLDHLEVFNAAAERLAYFSSAAVAEFVGHASGVAVDLNDERRTALEVALATLFETHLHGSFCRVCWHVDDNENIAAITHGAPIITMPTVVAGKEQVVCYRPLETAFLAYAASEGRVKLRRVGQARRMPIVAAFAEHAHGNDGRLYVESIATGRARAPDPHYRVVGSILVRRLSPNSRKIEAKTDPRVLLKRRMLELMGHELANCHAESERAVDIRRDLSARDPDWLRKAAKAAAEFVAEEQRGYAARAGDE